MYDFAQVNAKRFQQQIKQFITVAAKQEVTVARLMTWPEAKKTLHQKNLKVAELKNLLENNRREHINHIKNLKQQLKELTQDDTIEMKNRTEEKEINFYLTQITHLDAEYHQKKNDYAKLNEKSAELRTKMEKFCNNYEAKLKRKMNLAVSELEKEVAREQLELEYQVSRIDLEASEDLYKYKTEESSWKVKVEEAKAEKENLINSRKL